MKYNALVTKETAELYEKIFGRVLLSHQGYYTKFYHKTTGSLISYGRTGRTSMNRLYYAPYQHELQAFLRDMGYHIEVMLSEEYPYTSYYARSMKLGKYFSLSHGGYYPTYEDALENELQTLLKRHGKELKNEII